MRCISPWALVLAFLLSGALSASPIGKPVDGPITEHEREALIQVLIQELELHAKVREAREDDGRVIFIADRTPEGKWTDPPAEVFERLKHLPFPVHPVSKADVPEEIQQDDEGRVKGVTDRESGRPGWIHCALITKRIAATELEIEYEVYHGPLAAGGSAGIYRRIDGVWRLVKLTKGWVS